MHAQVSAVMPASCRGLEVCTFCLGLLLLLAVRDVGILEGVGAAVLGDECLKIPFPCASSEDECLKIPFPVIPEF